MWTWLFFGDFGMLPSQDPVSALLHAPAWMLMFPATFCFGATLRGVCDGGLSLRVSAGPRCLQMSPLRTVNTIAWTVFNCYCQRAALSPGPPEEIEHKYTVMAPCTLHPDICHCGHPPHVPGTLRGSTFLFSLAFAFLHEQKKKSLSLQNKLAS